MMKIGITGSLASGKSTASKFLSNKYGPLFDADKVVKKIYKNRYFKKIVSKKFNLPNNSHLKKNLKIFILDNKKNIKKLEKIIHPLVRKEMINFTSKNKRNRFLFYEIPLLIESKLMKYFDIIRVDHFNGFAKYWEVPAGDSNAVKGKWVKAKGLELLEKVFKENHNLVLIAEDLGEAAEDAKLIRDKFDIPGMDVLQYVFYNNELPNQFKKNTVLYTGTHDNDTLNGWYDTFADEISKSHKNSISKFLDLEMILFIL